MTLVAILHVTWSVNSVTHLFETNARLKFVERIPVLNLIIGTQPNKRKKGDRSRNNWFLSWFSLGESNHANHHAQPRAAYHGFKWYEPDMGKWFLMIAEPLGLVWDVKKPLSRKAFNESKKNSPHYV
jgi:fatty-acid desaturase